jgi:membrane protein YqaA with SNARE-associated domain
MNPERKKQLIHLLALIPVIGITIGIFFIHDQIPNLQAYGLPGIFLLSLLANATLILPVPGVVITTTMSAIFPPFLVALAAGTGAALGELTGYLAGYSGQVVIENRPKFKRLVDWMNKYGGWTILVLSFIPNPAFDMAGIVAGALKYPVQKFLSWCWLGKMGKMLMFAYAGAGIFFWLRHLFTP